MKSKDLLYLSLGFGLLAASCSQDDGSDTPAPADNSIRFTAHTDYTSRAGDITTNNLTAFHVFAYTGVSQKLFMDNVEVTKTAENTWTYSPLKFWPAENVDFYAYAPAGWIPTTGPKQPVHYENHMGDTDLVYAVSTGNHGIENALNAQVILNFRHALSKVSVLLSSTNPDLTVKVTNVAMANIKAVGDFNFPDESTLGAAASKPSSVGSWSNLASPYLYLFHMAQTLDEVVTLTPTPTDFTGKTFGGPKYMIPQPLAYNSGGTGEDTFAVVMCSVYDSKTGAKLWPNSNTRPENLVPGSSNKDGLLRFPLNTSDLDAWQPGYHYVYNIVVNSNPDMGSIEFGTPTVDTYIDVKTNY